MPDVNIRRDDKFLCGRLVAMPTTTSVASPQNKTDRFESRDQFVNTISVDFPAMPDTIELARSAEYTISQNNLVMPDGMHTYKGTKYLEIPFNFRIHSFDQQYCKKGALTLLQIAARLHSFVLPINTLGQNVAPLAPAVKPPPAPPSDSADASASNSFPNILTGDQQPRSGSGSVTSVGSGGFFGTAPSLGAGNSTDPATQHAAAQTTTNPVSASNPSKVGGIAAPVTCWLSLMWTDNNSPGISCIGYVREVSVKLNGPWLRGPNGSFNLPTSGDFSFVFIHRPGHGNAANYFDSPAAQNVTKIAQAFADDVKDNFYNTRHLIDAASYQGFGNNPSNETVNP